MFFVVQVPGRHDISHSFAMEVCVSKGRLLKEGATSPPCAGWYAGVPPPPPPGSLMHVDMHTDVCLGFGCGDPFGCDRGLWGARLRGTLDANYPSPPPPG